MFRTIFNKRHTFLPVVHVRGGPLARETTREQVGIACSNGADGVFLIGHGVPADDLLLIHQYMKEEFPGCWLGVNCLDLTPGRAFEQVTSMVDGVWVDNAEIAEQNEDQPDARRIAQAKAKAHYRGLYFGGVAFKYQRHVCDLSRGALLAKDFVDVVTTSGVGTGTKPPVEKIRTMKAAIGKHPLAIASGLTPENVEDYLDIADVFMVATGISKDFYTLDPEKVKTFAARLN